METNKQSTSLQILQPSKIAGLIKSNRLDELANLVPNSIEKIMDATPMCVLRREIDVDEIKKAIEFELVRLTGMLNVANNMKPHQIVFTAETIIENYPAESLEDIILCLRRGSMGYYGSTYHQLDTSVILGWLSHHIDEKCNYLEQGIKKSAQEEINIQVDYEAFKKKIELKRNEEEKSKLKRREVDRQVFLANNGGRKAYNVPIEDADGNPIGTIENVYAENYEGAMKIVEGMLMRGELRV